MNYKKPIKLIPYKELKIIMKDPLIKCYADSLYKFIKENMRKDGFEISIKKDKGRL